MSPRTAASVYPHRQSSRHVKTGELPLGTAVESYARQLYAEGKSQQTIERVYVPRIRAFATFLASEGMPTSLEGIKREHIETYILHLQTAAPGRKRPDRPGQMPATVSIGFRTLRGFFSWTVREDLLARSPMQKMRAPTVPEDPVPVLRESDLDRLLKVAAGPTFEGRRDTALLRLLYDTGMRRGEIAALHVADIDWTYNTAVINAETSKGKRGRAAPFGRKAAQALDRYLRIRARRPDSDLPWLWLGKRGRLRDSGILQVVTRRGEEAGIAGLHPHLFRHTFAHNLKASGMTSEDVALLGGWRDLGVMARYGRGAASERAAAAYRLVAPGDRVG